MFKVNNKNTRRTSFDNFEQINFSWVIRKYCIWHVSQAQIQGGVVVPPKTEHLNFWWQPFFFLHLFYLHNHSLLSYFSFFISFFNCHWKMFNRVFKTERLSFVICIYSFCQSFAFSQRVFHIFLWSLYWTKYLFYSFGRNYREIFYKIAVQHQW